MLGKDRNSNVLFILVSFLLIAYVYRGWFINKTIIGGDWPYLHSEYIQKLPLLPPTFSEIHGNGLGGKIASYGLDTYLYFTNDLGRALNLPWDITSRIFWFFIFLLLTYLSSTTLARFFFKDLKQIFASWIIFSTNTYILMVVGGGQMGVALAYSIAPFTLYFLAKGIHNSKKNFILFAFVTAVILALDPRIYVVACLAVFVFFLTSTYLKRESNHIFLKTAGLLFLAIIIDTILNSFWILPLLFERSELAGSLNGIGVDPLSVRFFSFATISNTFSLLHPNWPDNIFGKVYFQKPEFLLLPITAFICLFSSKKKEIISFSIVSLIGIFLAKGATDPLPEVYLFLFKEVPGFSLFRDPTKWYFLIAVSYAILIPYSLSLVSTKLKNKFPHILNKYIFFIFLAFWVFLIGDAVINLRGTFKPHFVPKEYIEFKNKVTRENEYFRTLWVPKQQRFTYSDFNHPSVEAFTLFKATNASELKASFAKDSTKDLLKKLSIKYIVIPYDSIEEIFLDDRKYSENKRLEFERILDSIPYLKKINDGKLTIYQAAQNNSLFYNHDNNIYYRRINSTKYILHVKTKNESIIQFSQSYSPSWYLRIESKKIYSSKNETGTNSFLVPPYNGEISVEFDSDKNYNVGLIISIISFLCLTGFYIIPFPFKK